MERGVCGSRVEVRGFFSRERERDQCEGCNKGGL